MVVPSNQTMVAFGDRAVTWRYSNVWDPFTTTQWRFHQSNFPLVPVAKKSMFPSLARRVGWPAISAWIDYGVRRAEWQSTWQAAGGAVSSAWWFWWWAKAWAMAWSVLWPKGAIAGWIIWWLAGWYLWSKAFDAIYNRQGNASNVTPIPENYYKDTPPEESFQYNNPNTTRWTGTRWTGTRSTMTAPQNIQSEIAGMTAPRQWVFASAEEMAAMRRNPWVYNAIMNPQARASLWAIIQRAAPNANVSNATDMAAFMRWLQNQPAEVRQAFYDRAMQS
jgi:hypothetical protein